MFIIGQLCKSLEKAIIDFQSHDCYRINFIMLSY